ncbi:MAG: YlbF family regulator [Lachnospirales bacterium]
MDTVFDKARELATLLLESEQGVKMQEARFVFENDEDAKAELLNYTNYRQAVMTRINSGELSEDEINAEKAKISDMIKTMQQNPIINNMVACESDFNMFVNNVMSVFQATLQGDDGCGDDCGCSGSCGSCGGCH